MTSIPIRSHPAEPPDDGHPRHGHAPAGGRATGERATGERATGLLSPIWWGLPARLAVAAGLVAVLWAVIVWAL